MRIGGRQNIRTIVINATNIGRKLNGIGVYCLSLLKRGEIFNGDLKFIIYVNKNSQAHVGPLTFPENCQIKWTTRYISPDYKFIGHLLRFLYSNLIPLKEGNALFFNTSQLEAMIFKREQILTVHDMIPLLFRKHHKKQYLYFRYFLKYALNPARAIITPSFHSKKQLMGHYHLPSKKIEVIYHGIEPNGHQESEIPFLGAENNFILYVGRSSPTKNVSGLLEAFEILKSKIPHKLILGGTFSEGAKTKYLADGKRMEVKGYLSGSELTSLYKRASLLVLPSFYEGFGFTPLEAMACGCPVVVSNQSSLPEICGDAAYYVDPYSIKSIADGIYEMLTNEPLRKTFIQKGLEKAKAFSWGKSSAEHLRVLTRGLISLNRECK